MPKQLRLILLFSLSTRSHELIFAYVFDAAGAVGVASGGTSGEQAFFCVLVLFSLCVHHLLECPGFICPGFIRYLLVVVPKLPIPQHGLFKDSPSFVTTCTTQGLVVKVTCMHDGWIVKLAICRPRATLSALNVCAPPGSTRKPWHYYLASALHSPGCLR
jgi:hypothetical protein